jgi:hypothetical protein
MSFIVNYLGQIILGIIAVWLSFIYKGDPIESYKVINSLDLTA